MVSLGGSIMGAYCCANATTLCWHIWIGNPARPPQLTRGTILMNHHNVMDKLQYTHNNNTINTQYTFALTHNGKHNHTHHEHAHMWQCNCNTITILCDNLHIRPILWMQHGSVECSCEREYWQHGHQCVVLVHKSMFGRTVQWCKLCKWFTLRQHKWPSSLCVTRSQRFTHQSIINFGTHTISTWEAGWAQHNTKQTNDMY